VIQEVCTVLIGIWSFPKLTKRREVRQSDVKLGKIVWPRSEEAESRLFAKMALRTT
jgi:hypothetical protein